MLFWKFSAEKRRASLAIRCGSKVIVLKRSTASTSPSTVCSRNNTPDRPSHDHAEGHHRELTEAVAALPTKQRQAVAYHYLAGLPYAEVATLLDSSAAAARRAAADGIATLRRRYTHDTETESADDHR